MVTLDLQKTSTASPYAFGMRSARSASREILAANVRALMGRRGWKQKDLEKHSGVSQRHISSVLRATADVGTSVLEGLGKAFGIPAWLLLVPGLKPDVLDSPEIPLLIERYAAFVPPRATR